MPGPFSWAVQTPTQTVVKVSVPLHYFSYLKGRDTEILVGGFAEESGEQT